MQHLLCFTLACSESLDVAPCMTCICILCQRLLSHVLASRRANFKGMEALATGMYALFFISGSQ